MSRNIPEKIMIVVTYSCDNLIQSVLVVGAIENK